MSINKIDQLGIQVKRESNYIVIGNYCYDMYITKDKLYLNGMRYFHDFATYWSKQDDVYGPLSGLKKLLVESEIEVGNELNWDLAKDILGTVTENKKNTVTYIGKDKNDYTGCGAPDYAPATDASEDEKERWKTICKEKEESDKKTERKRNKGIIMEI